jgi:hypothetical protein
MIRPPGYWRDGNGRHLAVRPAVQGFVVDRVRSRDATHPRDRPISERRSHQAIQTESAVRLATAARSGITHCK